MDSDQPDDGDDGGIDIHGWWIDTARQDAELYVAKATEYGSVDLEIMGDTMALQGIAPRDGSELAAIMFYALGKIARAISALNAGKLPSEDTLKDLTVYSMMARLIHKRESR
jgi:hypothetical protein